MNRPWQEIARLLAPCFWEVQPLNSACAARVPHLLSRRQWFWCWDEVLGCQVTACSSAVQQVCQGRIRPQAQTTLAGRLLGALEVLHVRLNAEPRCARTMVRLYRTEAAHSRQA